MNATEPTLIAMILLLSAAVLYVIAWSFVVLVARLLRHGRSKRRSKRKAAD